jgi:hypothetical protein
MLESSRGHVRERQPRPFPQKPRSAFGSGIQGLNVDRVQAGSQAERAAIVTQRVARRATDQPEGGPVFATSIPSITSRSPSRSIK